MASEKTAPTDERLAFLHAERETFRSNRIKERMASKQRSRRPTIIEEDELLRLGEIISLRINPTLISNGLKQDEFADCPHEYLETQSS
mmetsp:Transcript_36547/g.76057  ORF Transcript_36547/g.76057 Transcript_36547/m.76057 type:complete len:88 (+) Transcript_36547:1128-1391(+)